MPALLELLKKSSPLSKSGSSRQKNFKLFQRLILSDRRWQDPCATPVNDWINTVSRNYYQYWPADPPHFRPQENSKSWKQDCTPFFRLARAPAITSWPSGGNAPGPLHSEKQKQGLMQVYQDFCTQNENNCRHCTFPGVVNSFFSLKKPKKCINPIAQSHNFA